jgi:transcriptional regulator with XRE-family HTH domain
MFFGLNIKYLRTMKGMTQIELAEAMGVTSSTVTGWETGKSSPHFQVLLRLRDFFQVDLEKLVYKDLQGMAGEKDERSSPLNVDAGTILKLMESFEEMKGRMEALENRVNKLVVK